jgi:GTP:adenosylcobinamide-phosphate guanylyltransferase
VSAAPAVFSAVVLAGERAAGDAVARAAGVPCKALAAVGGRPMVLRVADALLAARAVRDVTLAGPPRAALARSPELLARIESGALAWRESGPGPSASAADALAALPPERPVLLTTADHALLSAELVDTFCERALASGRDVVAGVAAHAAVTAAFPGVRRTAIRLRDGALSGCNLFAFLTPRSRSAADFWRRVEAQRKKPLRVVGVFGALAVLRYLTGRLTLEEALQRVSWRLGLDAGVVRLEDPTAAVDVDSVADWELACRLAAERAGSG